MFEKHLWKSDILSKMQVDEMCFQQVFFKHFASINQLHGLSVSETSVKNRLIKPILTEVFPKQINMTFMSRISVL